ncbi:MAG: hypothetical protein BRD55_10810 [Bacteroidetes bacterium SW_9_63_38]|nr:MAG: hypothetical protein BRD55_10810 [Bacteroidetes bacterium SW_9_63_38]
MCPLRLSLRPLVMSLLLFGLVAPTSAQSVESVVENMKSVQADQFKGVDTYIVETNHYTSYSKKTSKGPPPTFTTETQMKSTGNTAVENLGTPSNAYGPQLDNLKKRATYEGTETVNGARCHVLKVDTVPSQSANPDAQGITYYVDANEYLIARMAIDAQGQGQGQGPSSNDRVVTVNLKNYTTTDGLTLPHRMEIQFDLNMSEQQRQQMKQMMEKMKNMPEQQRKRMQEMMGGQMDMMKQMMSDEPLVVEVQSVSVNAQLPDDVF